MWYLSSWRDLRRRSNAGHGLGNKPEITPPSHSYHRPDGTPSDGSPALLVELKAADEAQRLGSAAPFNFLRRPDREVAASGRVAQKCVHFKQDQTPRTASFPPKVWLSRTFGGAQSRR